MKARFLIFPALILLLVCCGAQAENPCPGHEKCGKEHCYWCTPMDISNEQAVWEMLCAPITVIRGNQKDQYLLRSRPDKNSEPVADVTYASQGVHVLEELDNGWTRVEVRSSSFSDSTVKAWNSFVTGYVETALLYDILPDNSSYAVVIDKLTQRCYIFRNGHLFSTLLCSTGKPNASQPYNETQSGEFLIVSPVGNFNSNELVCDMGLRFNRGNLLHQVPYILSEDGYQDFSTCESALGSRASHGCIRVQRRLTPEGTNMTWLWNNRKMNSRLVIWEDSEGRYLTLPDNETPVYVNSAGGKTYHSAAVCDAVAERFLPLKQIRYIDLRSEQYAALTPCKYCVPPLGPERTVELNASCLSQPPVYTDSLDGAYYHWDPYCILYDEDCLPLTYAGSASALHDILSPCPECVIKAQNPELYYNPSGGKYYHSNQNCAYVNSRYLPLSPFEYRELDTPPFSSLKPCPRCNAPKRGLYPTGN